MSRNDFWNSAKWDKEQGESFTLLCMLRLAQSVPPQVVQDEAA